MEDDDENSSLVGAVFSSIEDAALNADSDDPVGTKDAWWLRWLKYASIVLVPAIVLGGILFFIGLNARIDTGDSMKFRFWLGAGIGGGLGVIYVVRCIIRKVDP